MKRVVLGLMALVISGLGCSPDLSSDCAVDEDCPSAEQCLAGVCVGQFDTTPADGDGAATDGATSTEDVRLDDINNNPRDGGADTAPDAVKPTQDATPPKPDAKPDDATTPMPDQGAGGSAGDAGTGGTGGSPAADMGTGGNIPDAHVQPADAAEPTTDMGPDAATPDAGRDPDAAPEPDAFVPPDGHICQASPEVCDGVDNDCDADVDEEFPEQGQPCQNPMFHGVCQAGRFVCDGPMGLWCQPAQMPDQGNPDRCDGLDTDCDGVVDEDCGCDDPQNGFMPVRTTCGVGACAADGRTSCVNNVVVDSCIPAPRVSPNDTTCDSVDDDCDGDVDEEYRQVPTACGVGACVAAGQIVCVNGEEQDTCNPGRASEEICNGIDDDCDGRIDDDPRNVGSECQTGGQGICSTGRRECQDGALRCVQENQPAAREDCGNQLDDDCNGSVNDGCLCPPNELVPCYTGPEGTENIGACRGGNARCSADGFSAGECEGEVLPSAEPEFLCDGIDDDCNGTVDDFAATPCLNGMGVCEREGTLACDPEHPSPQCNAVPGLPQNEICDGLDNDCDGMTDEDEFGEPLSRSCYTGPAGTQDIGVCRAGQSICTEGNFGECQDQVLPSEEICDHLDNDCDGSRDDGFPDNDGDGWAACAGDCDDTERGVNPDRQEVCDNLDQNCSGRFNEGVACVCQDRDGDRVPDCGTTGNDVPQQWRYTLPIEGVAFRDCLDLVAGAGATPPGQSCPL